MAWTQQRFWPDAQPLIERLGRDFFLGLPESPGVYLMHGPEDTILYVGKAKNLRRRVGCYRVANPDRMPRRILRLLQRVKRISFEECPDEPAALRRESKLLLDLKPRFNRAGVWKGPARYLAWRVQEKGLELTVTTSSEPEPDWQQAGPFGGSAKYLHRALVRLLWCRFHPDSGSAGLPVGWFRGQHAGSVIIPHADRAFVTQTAERVAALTAGNVEPFVSWFTRPTHPFEALAFEEDVTFVTEIFSE